MKKLTTCEMQHLATEVSGLAQGVDQLYFGGLKEGLEAIPPMLTTITEKASKLSLALDIVNLPKASASSILPVPDSVLSDALHQAVTLKFLIENAANLDNEGRGEELTTILGVLCEKAESLVEKLDPPRSMAAE